MKKAFLLSSLLLVAALACNLMTPNTTPTLLPEAATVTPEVFIARTQAVPAQVQLNGVMLAVQDATLGECDLPDCPPATAGTRYLGVRLQALNLPAGEFPDYKNLPQGIAVHDETGTISPLTRLLKYEPDTQQLTLYFAVPETASVFGLQWPGAAEIPLIVVTIETPVPPTAAFEGVKVSVAPLSLVLPPGLANGISGEQFPRAEGDNVSPWELTPGHTVIRLEGYPLQDTFHEPKIFVYPAQGYAEMFPGAFESMHRLNNIFGNPGSSIGADQLPTVPFFNAGQLFASNIQIISFQNGKGVRFLTEYAQYFAPVNNHDLFYQFQGLTGDGAYYIIAILPVSSPVLAETSEAGAAVPAGGVALPDINDPNADWKGYYDAVANVLNAEGPETFGPGLSQLDALIQSMQIAP